jgi:hypothetical protein
MFAHTHTHTHTHTQVELRTKFEHVYDYGKHVRHHPTAQGY